MPQFPCKDRPAVPLSQLTACRLYMHSSQPFPANTMHYKGFGQIIPRKLPFDIDDF